MSNSLDPDQARHFVGPDLGPNRLQRLSEDDTIVYKVLISQIEQIRINQLNCEPFLNDKLVL